MPQYKIPLLVIVGPTAAGKSAVADLVAAKFNGVVINADARQIYRGTEIVSAAPRDHEKMRLYCFKNVNEQYSFAEYQRDSDGVIVEVWQSGHVPVVVGGTGLYIDALVQRFVPPPEVEPEIREYVAALSAEQALTELELRDPDVLNTIDVQNPRRVQRALEVILQTGASIRSFGVAADSSPYEVMWIGWTVSREELHERIAQRVGQMWNQGAVVEVSALLDSGHSVDEPGMKAIGVAEIAAFVHGQVSEKDAQEQMVARTRQYARRQLTWFRRNKSVTWYTSVDELCHSVHDFLQTNFKTS